MRIPRRKRHLNTHDDWDLFAYALAQERRHRRALSPAAAWLCRSRGLPADLAITVAALAGFKDGGVG